MGLKSELCAFALAATALALERSFLLMKNGPKKAGQSLMFLPDASYDARIEAKMKNRPFLLDSDPTDCSGIIPRSRVQKLLGGS